MGVYIFLTTSFGILNPDNFVNTLYRKKFIRNATVRKLLNLNRPGDARFEIAASHNLDIYLYSAEGLSLEPGTMETVGKELQRVLNAPVQVHTESLPLSSGSVGDADLENLHKKYRSEITLFLLGSYAPHPSYVGLVDHSDAMYIFKDAIDDVAHLQKSSTATEISTILHEFAHLLGAEHIDIDGCILSEKVEDSTYYNLPSLITDSFCNTDIHEIRRALAI